VSSEATFDVLRDEIADREVSSLFSPEFVACLDRIEQYTNETVVNLVRSLELEAPLSRGATVVELVAARGFSPKSATVLDWFLRKLEGEGYLDREETASGPRYRSRGPLPIGNPKLHEERAVQISPGSRPTFQIVGGILERVPAMMRGEATGEEVLFAPDRISLWFEYYSNDNILYAITNHLGAEALSRILPATRPGVVLELGGGSGSAALAAAARLSREGPGRLERWTLTDVVPTFLRRAERALRAAYPSWPFEFRRLDIEGDFETQGIAPGSVDVAYAVNTVHIARDLPETLRQIRRALRPGGWAVFSECMRPIPGKPLYVEFAFNFLDNFTHARLDPATRPDYGFLSPAHWRASLEAAGFECVRHLPDIEKISRRFPLFYAAAVMARRPAS
jgi:SAM-dependent methyltransferase